MMKKGFTLAEVLITLSIVAIVSALTIPAVVRNYRYKVYGATLKKTYSQIQDAANAIMTEEMTSDFFKTTAADSGGMHGNAHNAGARYFLQNYFKVTKNCSYGSNPDWRYPCIAKSYKTTKGVTGLTTYGHHCIVTINGAGICSFNDPRETNNAQPLIIDVNAGDEPNTVGIDAFIAYINPKGEVVDWDPDPSLCNKDSGADDHIARYARGCLTKVMQNDWIIPQE